MIPAEGGGSEGSWWVDLQASALEKGLLDGVDAALIGSLMAAIRRDGDAAFPIVVGALITAVRSGSIRIPLDPAGLAAHVEEFLKSSRPDPAAQEGHGGAAMEAIPAPAIPAASIPAIAARIARDFTAALRDGAYDAVAGKPGEFVPLIRTASGLYFQKYHAAEASVGSRLNALLAAPDLELSQQAIQELLVKVLERHPLRLSQAPDSPAMEFDPRQKEALALAIRKRFTVISGGPGTGKTSLAANLLRAWTRAWIALHGSAPRIRLAAPTGRAAQRLSESIRRSLESIRPAAPETADRHVRELACGTLHSLLRYNPGTGTYGHHAHRPLPADLILIDEVSMVDIFTLARVLDAMEAGAGLILLGDMDQLPSVEAGSVLADLVPRPGDSAHPLRGNLIALDRSHRSEARILDVTHRINAKQGAEAIAAMGTPLSLRSGNAPEAAADAAAAAAAAGSAGAHPQPIWPIAFLANGKRVCPEGGCRMLLPANAAGPAALDGGGSPAAYRAGWPAWLDAWIDFHYLDHSLDPARFPGTPLAAPRRTSYSALVADLCALPSPDDPRRDGLLEEAFAYLDQARILTFTRKSWHGAVTINRRIRERIGRRWDPRAAAEGEGGFAGSPLLILENDHGKGLFNGDVGIQVRIQGRDLAFFRRGEAFLGFAAAFLPRHETAFAMTIHKSQGSEYDYALVVLPEPGNRLLYKETLYTALTRARLFAGIYGPEPTFLEAVARNVVRESGLAEFLGALRR
jgi:exodeoxyribonuclease V alpha subunit